MSDSDSSLDFESADEGALNNNEEIDLSDLDLSDDDDDFKSKKETPKSDEPSNKVETNVQQIIQVEVESSSNEPKHSNQSVETIVKSEQITKPHLEKKTEKIDIDDPQKVETVEENLRKPVESEQTSKTEAKEVKLIEKSAVQVEKKPEKVASSGWDDSNWDDLDNDSESENVSDEAQISPINQTKKEEKNAANVTKLSKENTQEKPQLPTRSESNIASNNQVDSGSNTVSSAWGWSKFGSNFISSALNITAQIVESVEATIGAPDPAELAAKIAKSNASELEAQAGESAADQTSKFESDWNNDSQEWFTLPPLNKLASTVGSFSASSSI